MLTDIYSGKQITNAVSQRNRAFYESRMKKLSEEEYQEVMDYICELIATKCSKNAFYPGEAAGKDWTGTPLQTLYEKACGCDATEAGMLYGILVVEAFVDRIEEEWLRGTTQFAGRDFEQNWYMKKQK